MAQNEWEFKVSNPSSYNRSDYVEVDLDKQFDIPELIDEKTLRLFRIYKNTEKKEIPYQIDYIPWGKSVKRIMTFFSQDTPAGIDDYSEETSTFVIEKGEPQHFPVSEHLSIEYLYDNKVKHETWDKSKKVFGVNLYNKDIGVYFSLVPHLFSIETDYTGSAIGVRLYKAEKLIGMGEMLSPLQYDYPKKLWGQLTDLVFFPLPWELRWFHRFSLRGSEYELIYSNVGTMRAIIIFKSKLFEISYNGNPYFKSEVKLRCHLYRIFYVYPEWPFYTEEIFALTTGIEEICSISFRPYYRSLIHYPNVSTNLKRFEHIPDYFVVWKDFQVQYRGYGFASDAHIRGININGDEIQWRLPLTHHNKCIHYFMFYGYPEEHPDPFHVVGHYGWYEKLFKPLKVIPLVHIFPYPPYEYVKLKEG